MKISPSRGISLLLLLFSLLTLSGLVGSVAAMARPGVPDTCCQGTKGQEGSESSPCSAPDCPCFSCLTFEPTLLLTFDSSAKTATTSTGLPQFCHPADFVRLIDYPPEAS